MWEQISMWKCYAFKLHTKLTELNKKTEWYQLGVQLTLSINRQIAKLQYVRNNDDYINEEAPS